MTGKLNVSKAILSTAALIIAVVTVFPIYTLFISSFKPIQSVFDLKLIPDKFTLDNYIEIFTRYNFSHNILNSIFIAATVSIIALVFHSLSGYALARLNFPGKNFVFAWMLSTMMIPFAVIMIPLFIIVRNLGMMGSIWGIIIPMIPNAYGIFLLRQFYLGVPKEIEESAKIDGASHYRIFGSLFIPMSKPILLTLGISFFITNWNNYLWPLIIAHDRKLWVVQMAIANFQGEHTAAWNLIFAGSCFAVLPTIILFAIFQKQLIEGISMTGIKA